MSRPKCATRIRSRWAQDASTGLRRKVTRRVLVREAEAIATSERWNRDRARGQRRRFETVAHCGEGTIELACQGCGEVHEQPAECGCLRLCAACWVSHTKDWRARRARAHSRVREELAAAGYFYRGRRGGPYAEKHLVLTAPHLEVRDEHGELDRGATAARRIEVMHAAWDGMRRWIERAHSVPIEGERRRRARRVGASWYRGFEWTPGEDGCGHPHFHVWLLGPFLAMRQQHVLNDAGRLRRCYGPSCELCGLGGTEGPTAPTGGDEGILEAWSRALTEARNPVSADAVHVKLKAIRYRLPEFSRELKKTRHVLEPVRVLERLEVIDEDGDDVISYIEAWSFARMTLVDVHRAGPEVMAAVYCALEGRRLSQGSQVLLPSLGKVGFMALAEMLRVVRACCETPEGDAERPPKIVTLKPWFRAADGWIAHGDSSSELPPWSDAVPVPSELDRLRAELRDRQYFERWAPELVTGMIEAFAIVREDPSTLSAWRYPAGGARLRKTERKDGRYVRTRT